MAKLPQKHARPPRRGVDWPVTILVGGLVVAAAIVVGLLLAGLIYP